MIQYLIQRGLSLSAIFLLCASCGPNPQAGGGIGGTGSVATVSSGPVTGFGSVFVSDTEYDNTNTLYCIDHEPCSLQNRLKIGMVVLVNGTRSEEYTSNRTLTAIADVITYEETVEGFVQSVSADGLSLVVLGQIISVNQKTEVDPSLQGVDPHSLNPTAVSGALVEVSGFVTGEGTILATLITPESGTPHYEVEGFIKNHSPSAKTFEVGFLVVDYSHADISQMPSLVNQDWNGLVVFVQGDQWSLGGAAPYGARMTATSMKPKELGVTNIQNAEIEDFITQVNGPGDFLMNNVHVQTTSSTTYEGGTANDIVTGAHADVEGPLVGGIISATKVTFEGEIELQTNIATIDVGNNALTLSGLGGLTVLFDSQTELDGQGNPRRLDDLRVGDHLSIHGRLQGGSTVLATEVERTDPQFNVQVRSFITSAADPFIVLLGTSIDTSSIPESGFLGPNGVIGRSAFFSGLVGGKKVALRGTTVGDTVTWSSASRRDLF
ncbi:DUF5666 domain-containing protein [Petrachloros mirabilis]